MAGRLHLKVHKQIIGRRAGQFLSALKKKRGIVYGLHTVGIDNNAHDERNEKVRVAALTKNPKRDESEEVSFPFPEIFKLSTGEIPTIL